MIPVSCTVWKVYKCGVFFGRYFPVFRLNTWKYGPEKTPYLYTFHTVLGYDYDCLHYGMGSFLMIGQKKILFQCIKVDKQFVIIVLYHFYRFVLKFSVFSIESISGFLDPNCLFNNDQSSLRSNDSYIHELIAITKEVLY